MDTSPTRLTPLARASPSTPVKQALSKAPLSRRKAAIVSWAGSVSPVKSRAPCPVVNTRDELLFKPGVRQTAMTDATFGGRLGRGEYEPLGAGVQRCGLW